MYTEIRCLCTISVVMVFIAICKTETFVGSSSIDATVDHFTMVTSRDIVLFFPHFECHPLCLSLVQYNLILKNTSKLMTNFSLRNWEALPSSSEVRLAMMRPKMDDQGTDRMV